MNSDTERKHFCPNCGKEVPQTPGRKAKIYCCDKCRISMWYKKKRSQVDAGSHTERTKICGCCGKAFFAYDKNKNKYCSHECYINARFKGKMAVPEEKPEQTPSHAPSAEPGKHSHPKVITAKDVESYEGNPYIKKASEDNVELAENFFRAGRALLEMDMDEILRVFEINPRNFTAQEKQMFRGLMISRRESCLEEEYGEVCDAWFRIAIRRMIAISGRIEANAGAIGESIKDLSPKERKEICLSVRDLPKDPFHEFTISRLLGLMGISRNSYYCYIKNERYGLALEERDALDEKDVRLAFEYKGYRKGARLVYMLIPVLTGRKIGIDRVRRIMRKYGMESGVRGPNPSRRGAGKSLEARRKSNLLKRMFRLHRPNEVRITDVTYIKYGNGLEAYASALMDPVTNILVAFVVSESNDLELAKETLRRMDSHPCMDGGIFHSDQGSLYLSPEFQKEVEKLGLKQSMSKRGNCWDNAPQESFFGHFKDECDYSGCKNIEELRKTADGYSWYYNNERGMWGRKHMTPIKYEEYLLSLSKAEWDGYMKGEEKKYKDMKAGAAKKAKERYKTLGV